MQANTTDDGTHSMGWDANEKYLLAGEDTDALAADSDADASASGSCNRRKTNTDWLTPDQIEAGWLG